MMDEFSFIDMIKQKTYRQPGLIKGVGDDATVFRQPSEDIVSAVDMFVEGVHFSKDTMDAYHVGYKVLAVNISDIAAMGAMPLYYLVGIACPKTYSTNEYEQIFKGMRDAASLYNMDLIGGDTVSGNELAISVTVIGSVPRGKARYRHQARQGDIVFVTGTLGDSQAGMHILVNQLNVKDSDYFIKKHQYPKPAVCFVENLYEVERLALNDISDGIANEINEIAQASKVSIELVKDDMPVSENYRQFPDYLQEKWLLYGGEDFELVGTVSDKDWDRVKKVAEQTNTQVTKVGFVSRVETSEGQAFLWKDNERIPLYKKGYTHLK